MQAAWARVGAGITERTDTRTGPHYGSVMEYSFAPPTATEFKALYDETGWADRDVDRLEAEGARGAGVGGQVLARLVDEARRRGVDDVQLFAARGRAEFYERHGFERRPDSGPGMDVANQR